MIRRRTLVWALIISLLLVGNTGCQQTRALWFHYWNQKGESYFAQKKFSDAVKAWRKATEIQPDDADVYRRLGAAYVRLADFSKAIEALQKLISLQPDAWEGRLELAKLQLISGDIEAAEKNWGLIHQQGIRTPEVYVFQGDLMIRRKRLDKAESAYKQALEMAPSMQMALIKISLCYLAQGKMDLAERTYEILISLKSISPELLIQMSHYWRLRDDISRAEKFLLQAIDRAPEDLSYQKRLTEFYYDVQSYDKAYDVIIRIIRGAPENREVKKLLVEILLSQARMGEARKVLDELSRAEGGDPELELLLGKYYLLSQEPFHAVSYFQSVIEREYKLPGAYYLLAFAYIQGRQNHLAVQSLVRALMLDPYFSEAELVLADLYYKREEFDMSLEYARRVHEREPENVRALMIMGNNLLAQGRYPDALNQFKTAQRLYPEGIPPYYYMAVATELSPQKEKAIPLYQSLLIREPHLVDATLRYTRLLIQMGKFEMAKQAIEEGVQRNPRNSYLLHLLGELYYTANDREAAKKYFEESISLNSKMASSYLKLAEIHRKERNWDKQVHLLKECADKVPDCAEAYVELGRLYMEKDLWEQAIKTLEEGVRRNPESPILANCLAWLYLERDRNLNDAFSLAQAAYERMPEDPAIMDTLGWAFYKMRLFTRASWFLTEAKTRKPDNAIIRYHLGTVAYVNGDHSLARESLLRAIALQLPEPHKAEAEKLLHQLRK